MLLLKGGLLYFCSDPPDGESSKARAQQKLQSLLNNIKTSGHRRVLAKEPAIAKPKVQKLPKKDKVRILRTYGNGCLTLIAEVNDQSCLANNNRQTLTKCILVVSGLMKGSTCLFGIISTHVLNLNGV